jgi:hypothetical protein
VEAIVGHRDYNGKLMYKIRWKNYEPIHDTWETYANLTCPDLLEAYNIKHHITIPKHLSSPSKRGRKKKEARTPNKKRKASVSSGDENDSEDEPPYDEGSDNDEYEVNDIVDMRVKKDGSREFLVRWKRWSKDYDTWEPEANLNCPEIIEKYLKRLENAKNSNAKELRTNRKHTDHFTLLTHDSGRRLSKRHNKKLRVTYYGNEASDESS